MMIDRLKKRLPDADSDILAELLQTIKDRLCIRLGAGTLPQLFESICVDATVKATNRMHYEGIASEGAVNITTSFVEDILSEYTAEIQAYRDSQANGGNSDKVVRFR